MDPMHQRSRRLTLWIGIPMLALAGGLLIVVFAQPRTDTSAAVVTTSLSPISRISLETTVAPALVSQGQTAQAHFLISVLGGPGPITIGARIPKDGGGTYDVSFTTMIDRDATYGFDMPIPMEIGPGTYNVVFKAAAYGNLKVAATKTVTLTVRPSLNR